MTSLATRNRPKGRPSLYPKVRARLLKLIAKGVPFRHACAGVGITFQCFCNWRNARPRFAEQIERAVATAIELRLQRVEEAAKTDWRASAWLLEHLHPEHFAKSRLEVTGADGAPLAGAIAIYLPQKDAGDNGRPVLPVNATRKEIGDAN